MNKDRAIQLLERMQNPEPYDPQITSEAFDAIQMAIDALSADGDTISRKAAIDALDEIETEVADGYGYQYAKWRKYFAELPPAQPEIVRCKDCLMHGICRFERGLGLDGYCSQAERRTDG